MLGLKSKIQRQTFMMTKKYDTSTTIINTVSIY